jgi:hypothetical protein
MNNSPATTAIRAMSRKMAVIYATAGLFVIVALAMALTFGEAAAGGMKLAGRFVRHRSIPR